MLRRLLRYTRGFTTERHLRELICHFVPASGKRATTQVAYSA